MTVDLHSPLNRPLPQTPSSVVLSKFLHELRLAAGKLPQIKKILRQRLKDSKNREPFKKFVERLLGEHQEDLTYSVSADVLTALKATGQIGPHGLTQHALLKWIYNRLTDKRLTSSNLDALLTAGLGVEFLRYDHATAEYRNHCVLSDLLPEGLREFIQSTVSIPSRHGTVGWSTAAAKKSGKVVPAVLWSAASDPKGFVASHDLLQGVRSWAGIPIFDDTHHGAAREVGFLFIYFPVDGMFLEKRRIARKSMRTGLKDESFEILDVRSTPIVRKFVELASRFKGELLLALQLEEKTRIVELAQSTDQLGSEHGDAMSLLTSLAPESVSSIPVAVEIHEDYSRRREVPQLQIIATLREQEYLNRLLELLRTSSAYPQQWGTQDTSIAAACCGVSKRSTMTPGQCDWTATPSWNGGPRISIVGNRHAPRLPEEVQGEELTTPSFHETTESARASLQMNPQSTVANEYSKGLALLTSECEINSLNLPLTTLVGESHKCQGLITIACRRAVNGADCSSSLKQLELFFSTNPAALNGINAIAGLLRRLDSLIADGNQQWEGLRVSLDLRHALCQLLAKYLASQFDRRQSPSEAAELFTEAHKFYQSLGSTHDNLYGLALEAAERCDLCLRDMSMELQTFLAKYAPRVAFVTIWLASKQPVISKTEGPQEFDVYEDLIKADPGALRTMRFLVRATRRIDSPLELRLSALPTHVGLRKNGRECQLAIPPLFFRSKGKFVHATGIKLQHSRDIEGDLTRVTLTRSRSRVAIDWQWNSHPEPVAMASVAGEITACVMANDSQLRGYSIRSDAPTLPLDSHAPFGIHDLLTCDPNSSDTASSAANGDPVTAPPFNRLNDYIRFVLDSQPESRREPEWFKAVLSPHSPRGALLVASTDALIASAMHRLGILKERLVANRQQQRLLHGDVQREALVHDLNRPLSELIVAIGGYSNELHGQNVEFRDTASGVCADGTLLGPVASNADSSLPLLDQCEYLKTLVYSYAGNTEMLNDYCDLPTLLRSFWRWNDLSDQNLKIRGTGVRHPVKLVPSLICIWHNLVLNATKFRGPQHFAEGSAIFRDDSTELELKNSGEMSRDWIDFLQQDGPAPSSTSRGLRLIRHHVKQLQLRNPTVDVRNGNTSIKLFLPHHITPVHTI